MTNPFIPAQLILYLRPLLINQVNWSEVWQMRFNVDKCKVMHLGRGNPGGSYVMNGGSLGAVQEERDLGVRSTSDLKASAHCVPGRIESFGHDC